MRCLVGRAPFADLFGVKGRRGLAEPELPVEECETVDAGMRQIEFLDSEIAQVDRLIARDALASAQIRRLRTAAAQRGCTSVGVRGSCRRSTARSGR
jgi:hypothetical protein